MARRSSAIRSAGRHRSRACTRALARTSQEANWALKSAGEAKRRPGKKLVSK